MKEQQSEPRKPHGENEEIIDKLETRFKQFKNFDIVRDPPYDHPFLSKPVSSAIAEPLLSR